MANPEPQTTQYVSDQAANLMGRLRIGTTKYAGWAASMIADSLLDVHGDDIDRFVGKMTYETLGKLIAGTDEGKKLLREVAGDTLIVAMVENIHARNGRGRGFVDGIKSFLKKRGVPFGA